MKNGDINNKEFEKFLEYNKIINDYEESVDSITRSGKEMKDTGYLVYNNDYNELKQMLSYNYYKKNLNGDIKKKMFPYFDIDKFNKIKPLEPIKIKSADYIKNIIINFDCILVTEKVINIFSHKKENLLSFTAKNDKITLSINHKEKLELKHKNFILDKGSYDKNEPYNNEINNIFNSINAFFKFENKIANNLVEDRTKYGLLLKKSWIDEWKDYSNYEYIKKNYLNEIKNNNIPKNQENLIIKEIIEDREENKFKYKFPSETTSIEFKDEYELKNALKEEQLILVNSDFKCCFPYFNSSFLGTKYQFSSGIMKLFFQTNNFISFKTNDNIFSFEKIFGEIDESNEDLKQLIKIFCFQHSFPDNETKVYNVGNCLKDKIILINKNKIQKYKNNFNYDALSENLKKIIKTKKEIMKINNIIDYEKLNDNIMDKII